MPRAGRRRRLSRASEFERVYRHGRSKANRFLVLYAFPRGAGGDETRAEVGGGALGQPRLGLSVSKRVGGAVERARVKRTLREAFDARADGLPDGSDYVIVARPPARELAEREGTAGIERELAELIAALGGAARPDASAPHATDPPEVAPPDGTRPGDGSAGAEVSAEA